MGYTPHFKQLNCKFGKRGSMPTSQLFKLVLNLLTNGLGTALQFSKQNFSLCTPLLWTFSVQVIFFVTKIFQTLSLCTPLLWTFSVQVPDSNLLHPSPQPSYFIFILSHSVSLVLALLYSSHLPETVFINIVHTFYLKWLKWMIGIHRNKRIQTNLCFNSSALKLSCV